MPQSYGMKKKGQLIISALGAIGGSFDAAHLPTRLKLFDWGDNPSSQGNYVVNEVSEQALRRQISGKAYARVVIDFDHQSEPQSPTYLPSPRHHAGYGLLEVIHEDGIYLTDIEWTEKGREFAPGYSDISPVVIHTKSPQIVIGISSIALVPNGALVGKTLFAADFNNHKENPTMSETNHEIDVQALEAALKKATEDLAAAKDRIEELSQEVEALKARTNPSAETVAALDAKAKDQEEKISTLAASLESLKKDQLIQAAAAQGKVVTLSDAAVAKLSAEDLAQHISALNPTIPMQRRTPSGNRDSLSASALSAMRDQLIAQIRKETGCNFQSAWDIGCRQRPDLF